MSYYKLSPDVYLVKGAARHCIYNLAKGSLYNIDQEVCDLITNLINIEGYSLKLSTEHQEILKELISRQLLVSCRNKEPIIDILSLIQRQQTIFSWIEVTRRCNLSCSFCYEESNPYCSERLSKEDFYFVCDQLNEIGVKKIQLIGGEPLILKEDLKQMIEYASKYFSKIEVYSNGILIDEDWAKFFKAYGLEIAISIHSYSSQEHDHLTNAKGSHEKALRALELLKKYGVAYRLGTVANKAFHVDEPPENASYTLRPKDPKIVGRADLSHYNLEMFKRKAITKESKSYPLSKDRVISALSGHQCFAKNIYISSKLEVYPCVMERRLTHGNLRSKTLKDILKDEIRFLSKDYIEGCRECEFRYACFDCRPDSNGRGVYQKPWYCTYSSKEGKWYDVSEVFEKLRVHLEVGAR